MTKFTIPFSLIFLDGLGVLLLVLGFLGAQGIDLGLPALNTIWPFLVVFGAGLMAPMVVWLVRLALRMKKENS